MFQCDSTKLKIRFQEFHKTETDPPEYGEFCFLKLKDGSHTAGIWIGQRKSCRRSGTEEILWVLTLYKQED